MALLAGLFMVGGGTPALAANTAGITGQVSIPAGTDVGFLYVYAHRVNGLGSGSALVDADGTYEIAGLQAGSYRVQFSPSGGNDVAPEWYDDQPTRATSTLLELSDGEVATGIDADLELGGRINGTVSVPESGSLTDIIVTAYRADTFEAMPTSSVREDGAYTLFQLPAGNYKLLFRDMYDTADVADQWYGGARSFNDAKEISVDANEATAAPEQLVTGGIVSGEVAGLGAQEYTCAHLYPTEGPTELPEMVSPYAHSSDSRAIGPMAAATDPCGSSRTRDSVAVTYVSSTNGTYNFAGVAPGTYRIYLQKPVYSPDPSQFITDTRAPQWLAEKVLKTAAAEVTVEADTVTVGPSTTAFPARVFSDVPKGVQFFDEMSWLGSTGISTGWTERNGSATFRPLTPIARDAMAVFIYRLAGSPAFTPPKTSPFVDVATDNVYYKEITWLAAEGISTGWDEGNGKRSFRPLNPIARDAMAVFLYRFAGEPTFNPPAVSPFTDVSTTNLYYDEIAWLASAGISTGWTGPDGSSTFRFLNPVNRDAMAAFMERYAEMINAKP